LPGRPVRHAGDFGTHLLQPSRPPASQEPPRRLDDFNGSTLGSAWTALDRSGPGSQSENLCNKPSAVTVSGGNLVNTTSATPATCGDAVSSPAQYPFTSGSIQWTNLGFTYGAVEIRAKFPPRNIGTWPALWLLGAECQAANVVNGSEAVPFMGCPAQGDSAYREIDMVECDTRSWCHLCWHRAHLGGAAFVISRSTQIGMCSRSTGPRRHCLCRLTARRYAAKQTTRLGGLHS